MSDLRLAWCYLRSRLLVTTLTVASIALGLGLAVIVLLLSNQASDTLSKETGDWDLVVGAKGSQLQLVLNGIYYLEAPNGYITTDIQQRLQQDKRIDTIVPLTMGDTYYGVPIVGTTPAFLTARQAPFAQGHPFSKPFEAVIGAEAASRFHALKLGEKFAGSHGWTRTGSDDVHNDFPYTVVGVLAPTGTSLDRAIYTDFHSTWILHMADTDEKPALGEPPPDHRLTALLVRMVQPIERMQLQRVINTSWQAMAAAPVDEIGGLTKTFIRPVRSILMLVVFMVVLVSALSILISLYLTIHARRRDLAILRSLGATQTDVFRLITLEASTLSGLGVISGWLLGHLLLAAGSPYCLLHYGVSLNAWQIAPLELIIAGCVWVLGICAGLLPAIIAYRLPVAETLIRE